MRTSNIAILMILAAIALMPLAHAADVTDYALRYRLENDYLDENNTMNLSAGGTGNAFTTNSKEGTYSLTVNGAGWASNTGTLPLTTGNHDRSLCVWANNTDAYVFTYMGGTGANTGTGSVMYIRDGENASVVSLVALSNDVDFNVPTRTLNQWYHYCMVYHTSQAVELYQDGVNVANGTTGVAETFSATRAAVGTDFNEGSGSSFIGSIDDFRAYDYALTTDDVANIYASYTPSPPSNSVPVMATASLTASGNNATLTLTANATDAENEVISYDFELFKDGVSLGTNTSGGNAAGVLVTLYAYTISQNGTYIAQVTPSDPNGTGAALNSSPVTVTFGTPCSPSWVCSSYAACAPGNTRACLNVTDGNLCGQVFNGSLSTYNGACSYVAPGGSYGGSGVTPSPSSVVTTQPVAKTPAPSSAVISADQSTLSGLWNRFWSWLTGLFA